MGGAVTVELHPDGVSFSVDAEGMSLSFVLPIDEVDALVKKLIPILEGTDGKPRARPTARRGQKGGGTGTAAVRDLIEGGVLAVGEELHMKSGGLTHRARIREDGSFDIGGHVERSPTQAATYAAQSRRSGWRIWVTADGQSLEDLRWRLRASKFRDPHGDPSETVQDWTDYCLERWLKPNQDQPDVFKNFCEDIGVEEPGAAMIVLRDWFAWCADNRWTRQG